MGPEVDAQTLDDAIVLSVKDSAIPHVDRQKLIDAYGAHSGGAIADRVDAFVRAAASMSIEWCDKSLADGVEDVLARFSGFHPDPSGAALAQIGRCVGWQLR
ncbi:hypothetical protein [Mycolicibacterium sp.]|uniref:hypothetical protein n=1 Tax=Mycolicibacterium sp. TaxID=2320850 RepID=UPI00355ED4AC